VLHIISEPPGATDKYTRRNWTVTTVPVHRTVTGRSQKYFDFLVLELSASVVAD
jgi:hypothetical protein